MGANTCDLWYWPCVKMDQRVFLQFFVDYENCYAKLVLQPDSPQMELQISIVI